MLPDPALEGAKKEDAGVNNTICRVIATDQWEKVDKSNLPHNNNTARVVKPIPWTGRREKFDFRRS